MNANEAARKIIEYLGGAQNIVTVTNCMTRLRVVVRDDAAVDADGMKEMAEVLGLVHDRPLSYEVVVGPGKSRKYADICHDMGLPSAAADAGGAGMFGGADSGSVGSAGGADSHGAGSDGGAGMFGGVGSAGGADSRGAGSDRGTGMFGGADSGSVGSAGGDWKQNKEKIKAGQKENKLKSMLKVVGDIFVPLIPGVIAAGLCAGFASLISQLVPDYTGIPAWNFVYTILSLVNTSFMTYITAWAGYRAAERFGATPILGGMLGLITNLEGINTIAQIIGLYNAADPLQSILRAGKGGVLAVVIGVLILSVVEKKIRRHMPDSMDIVFTPILSLLVVMIPYILIVMPVFGYVSSGIAWVFGKACMSTSVIVRLVTGYIASALFLPLVAAGMHHGMVALYTVQLQELGFVTLYPALAMAGAGQVGASLAILKKSKRTGNARLTQVIRGALPAGFLGVGEPLIYGVTLPMGRPFVTAGLGAGFGGAFVMMMQVASTTWGPSGLLGIFVMTAGPKGPLVSIACYVIGLVISYVMSYVITGNALKDEDVMPAGGGQSAEATGAAANTVGAPGAMKQSAGKRGGVSGVVAAGADSGEMISTADSATTGEMISTADSATAGEMISTAGGATAGAAMNTGKHKHIRVRHGETISFDMNKGETSFRHIIADPLGIHARPAGELAGIIKKYDCHFVIEAGGKTARGGSVIQLMSLGAVKGTELYCHAEGRQAAEAVSAVSRFMKERL